MNSIPLHIKKRAGNFHLHDMPKGSIVYIYENYYEVISHRRAMELPNRGNRTWYEDGLKDPNFYFLESYSKVGDGTIVSNNTLWNGSTNYACKVFDRIISSKELKKNYDID